jgi:murein DD-endopeptidase MepM/ murein hydrolase activator NlpD
MAVPFAQAADDDLEQKQDEVEQQIEHAHDDLEHSSKEVRAATAQLETAQAELEKAREEYAVASAKLTAAQARDAELRTELAAAEQRLTEARADLTAGEQAVKDQRAQFVDRVTGLYVKGDPRLLGLSSILAADDPNDLLRRVQANDTVVAKEDAAYDELRSIEVLLRVRETQVQDAQEAVAEQQAAAAAHVATMETLAAEAAAAQQEVAGLVATARAARTAAWAARRQDQQVLQQLKQREARIKQQILAAARAAARRAARTGSNGYSGDSDGFLSSPTPGASVTSPFGYREHPIYHYWGLHDGTDFGVGCGTPLHAVADGTVMQEYWSSVYGNRLYLNVGRANGTFLTAVYNHATRYTVSPGDRVRRGQVIGYVGSTGWSTGCHLHFTVLANGNAVDPMNWL